ncbi:hypothetical protein HIM_07114 [Hirsutella minnesotensis 3608]|uniref:Uncharacterized protein n=1 Tax=Hirsutella minnesotensis 3608 TaxID=1043627 RepID=A0A0F7ZTR2_9HYPO|nr:hypothetical protein HIM_07114 [Hirsutella minnesotensis 3608]
MDRQAQGRQHGAAPQIRSSAGLPQSRRFDGASPEQRLSPQQGKPTDEAPESWVEVSSQPSSSSLSSIGDEIVTTGLRVRNFANRRRRSQPLPRSQLPQQQQPTAVQAVGAGSSQEEYEESDSEEDHVLTSSSENVKPAQATTAAVDDSDADSDDGDSATALGRASDRPVFRPQPNAFSHPPSHLPRRSHSATSAVPPHPHGSFSRPSFSQRSQTRAHHNFMSPANAREDNEAALRASLTTLLSCAAAARGLPKTKEEAEARRLANNGIGPSSQPMELRLVQESELTGVPAPGQSGPLAPADARQSPDRSPTRAGIAADKHKRAVSAGRSPRATKKKKTAAPLTGDASISPTLLTWVMSAGVVVLVSAVGFGAGYVMGREVGRQEALAAGVSGVNETTRCGREVIGSSGGGLRRLRWGAVGRSIVAQA